MERDIGGIERGWQKSGHAAKLDPLDGHRRRPAGAGDWKKAEAWASVPLQLGLAIAGWETDRALGVENQ